MIQINDDVLLRDEEAVPLQCQRLKAAARYSVRKQSAPGLQPKHDTRIESAGLRLLGEHDGTARSRSYKFTRNDLNEMRIGFASRPKPQVRVSDGVEQFVFGHRALPTFPICFESGCTEADERA